MNASSETESQPASLRQKLLLAGLVLVFVSPILIAWAYTAGLINLNAMSRTNRGLLVSPPVDLRAEPAVGALFGHANLQPGEWVLTYTNDGACENACRAAIDKLTTIRSLLGYSGQRVRVVALATAAAPASLAPAYATHVLVDPDAYAALQSGLAAHVTSTSPPQIVFIDWRRQLVMRYDEDAPSIDIKKDLKKLLRASQIR